MIAYVLKQPFYYFFRFNELTRPQLEISSVDLVWGVPCMGSAVRWLGHPGQLPSHDWGLAGAGWKAVVLLFNSPDLSMWLLPWASL